MDNHRHRDTGATYAESWEEFIAKIDAYSPKKRASMIVESRWDAKIGMIVALSADWRAAYSAQDAMAKVRQAQARIIEERRMALKPTALRPYVDPDTRALMPPIKLRRGRYARERKSDHNRAGEFWRGMQRGSWRGQTVPRIVENERARILDRTRESYPIWLLRHPDRTPTPQRDIDMLRATFRAMNPPARGTRPAIDPAGMTPERALAIALRAAAR